MKVELGAKKDIYTSSRCMSSGILLGRMSTGLALYKRALEDKSTWTPRYGVSSAAGTAHSAGRGLERLLPAARPHLKSFMEIMERYKDHDVYGFDKERAEKSLQEAHKHLAEIAQAAVKSCGKRRPEAGEGEALLRMKRVKRAPVVKSTPEPMRLPEESTRPLEVALPVVMEPVREESGTPWGVIAGVALVIGAAFLAG